ncbi:YIP1 family protein [Lutimaribacter sp. EGI FJ00015]|uniref:YIP1 family protein n=1 Tax=Lutimaribacter degradans TaxID=2945989 RepID=A0ACC5ZWJ1_9RHOB|nr:Yip1 family protein [Lutimaribacter sp. EGI FJ00013]MCM2562220.1 YIP1 family protein [Lutimaribacter sp. EGI FJ00013]MCO0613375.1 YIP1 family protein [Lutimaribacter sp. EGI FJ00015]MCO0636349.1 YIP1 family protein [Lutimaribacter sp. EGI FJ00014]
MTTRSLKDLAVQTLTAPREAAEYLLGLNIARNTLWMALVLATVLNALLFSLSNYLFPTPMPMQGLFDNPLLYALAQGGGLAITVFVLTWVGNMMGGKGQLGDVLIALVWLQFMRVLAQALVIVLGVAIPMLGGLVSLAVLGLSVWILLNFINVAHQFDSLGKSFLVLFLAAMGVSFGISIILMLIGVSAEGVNPNV